MSWLVERLGWTNTLASRSPHRRRPGHPEAGWPIVGTTTTLLTTTPVAPGREAEAETALDDLHQGRLSPFASLPRTHFARMCLLDHVGAHRHGEQRWPLQHVYVLFCATFDGDEASYVADLVDLQPALAEAVWSTGIGYPGLDGEALLTWLQAHRLAIQYPYATSPAETVASVRAAVDLRRDLISFSVAAQDLSGDDLLAEFQRRFGAA